MVVLKPERPGDSGERLQQIDDTVFDARMGDFNVHPRGANGAMNAHRLTIDELAFQRRQAIAHGVDMLKHRFEPAHHKFALRVDLP